MNTYKNDKNINIERENIEVNVEKLQIYGPRSKTAPSCTLTADQKREGSRVGQKNSYRSSFC